MDGDACVSVFVCLCVCVCMCVCVWWLAISHTSRNGPATCGKISHPRTFLQEACERVINLTHSGGMTRDLAKTPQNRRGMEMGISRTSRGIPRHLATIARDGYPSIGHLV